MRRLRSRFALLVLLASVVVSGCSGEGGNGGPDGVILDAQPRFALRGRQAAQTIAIRGDETHWASDGLTVDDLSFGAGIEITRLAVANDRYLEVDLRVLPDADLGYRDIVVGGLPFAGIFRVSDPFRVVAGTPIKAGRFFRAVVEGTETNWIDGVEVTTDADQVLLDGQWLALGNEALGTDVLGDKYLEITGYTHWYAFNGTGGEIDLLVGLGPENERDLGVGALEVEPEPRIELDPSAAVQGLLDESLATSVYAVTFPAYSKCYPSLSALTPSIQPIYELYHPAFPAVPWAKIDPQTQSYQSDYVFDAQPMYVVVHDALQRGGADFQFALTADCVSLNQTPLTEGVVTNGAIAAQTYENGAWYTVTPTRWGVTRVVVTPTSATPDDHRLYFYPYGTLDALPEYSYVDAFSPSDPSAVETLIAFTGTRPTALLEAYAGGSFGPTTAFDIEWTEFPMPGGAIHENLSPLDIVDDGTPVTSTILIAGEGTAATGVHVALDILHGASGDLTIDLVNPQGAEVRLYGQDGFGQDILALMPDLILPTAGVLSDLVAGGDPNGTWTLRITDGYLLDAGQLKGWALTFE